MDDQPRNDSASPPAPVDYRTAPFVVPRGRHWITKPPYWLILLGPSLPLLVFLLPSSAFAGAGGADPWYTVITTPIWLFVTLYVFPATAVAGSFGAAPLTPLWAAFVLAYTLAIGYGLCALLSRPG